MSGFMISGGVNSSTPSGGGGATPTISITNQSPSRTKLGSSTATYALDNDGSVYLNASTTATESWISAASAVGDYQVQATLSSGTTPTSGTLGSWLVLSTDRSWTLTNSAGDDSTLSCVLTIEIRDTATSTVRDTATITMSATSLSTV